MVALTLRRKLEILSDAAKYDASCASSGGARRNSLDGRIVSLLKILLTNFCVFDCVYCINRVSSNVARARFSVEEVVRLTLDFYKRNYIEGLFLSSGVIQSADYTQEQLTLVAKTLREVHDFRGYIHLKLIAGASPELAAEAGLYADRLSVNIELPRDDSLERLAPEKTPLAIKRSMGAVRMGIEAGQDTTHRKRAAPRYAPAGQSSQMIVGADGADDADVLLRSEQLYGGYGLKRVYYSAFSPIPDSSSALPLLKPPMMREHRLYQADWLMRFYGFEREEIVAAQPGGMLDLAIDPKLAWALANRHRFPVDVNRAEREMLLRLPGLGVKSVNKILSVRRYRALRLEDVRAIAGSVKRLRPFVICADWSPGSATDAENLREAVTEPIRAPVQMSLF